MTVGLLIILLYALIGWVAPRAAVPARLKERGHTRGAAAAAGMERGGGSRSSARALPRSSSRWSTAVASAYSRADSPGTVGCTGRPLRDDELAFASYQVPCGARVTFCYRGRCVTAVRNDSGPNGPHRYTRQFDLQAATVRALCGCTPLEWGVRTVLWRRAS